MSYRLRRLWQFSLRSLLLLALLVGLVCGTLLIPATKSRRELPVIARIEKRGGTAVRSFLPTPATEFAARFLGQEPFLRVTDVSLTESGATDADLPALGRLGELRKLDLSHTYVTDDGLSRLVSGLPELRELDLTLANIGPRGLAALAGNSKLETVYTLGTATEYADLEALAKKLPGVPLVEERARQEVEELGGSWNDDDSLDLSFFEPHEGDMPRLFAALSRLPSLRQLVLGEAVALPSIDQISKLRALRSLHLEATRWRPDEAGPPDYGSLASLKQLNEISIEGAGDVLPDAAFSWLAKLPELRRLALKGMLTGPQLELLRRFTRLHSLALSPADSEEHCYFGIDLEPLAGLTSLAELELRDTPIGDDDLRTLAGLKALHRLVLAGTRVRGRGLAHLRDSQHLVELDLSNTPFDDEAISELAHFPQLTTLDLSRTRVTERRLRELPVTVRRLTLHDTAVSAGGCRDLVKLRPDLTVSLHTPNGHYADISAQGTNTSGGGGTPDIDVGTWRLQAREWLYAGDYPGMAHAYLQAGKMPFGSLGDYHRAAFALGLDQKNGEALSALREGNFRALAEVRNSPTATRGALIYYAFTLGHGSPWNSPSSIRDTAAKSLAMTGRMALEVVRDPPAARVVLEPVRTWPESSDDRWGCLRLLAAAQAALDEPVAAVDCAVEWREREIGAAIRDASQPDQTESDRNGAFGAEEDAERKPLADRWEQDDPAVELATLYASLAGHRQLPDVPVLGLVSEAQPLVIDLQEERCWKFAWGVRGWNDFALVPPPGQAFAELSIVCEAPGDEHLCPVSCWIGNRADHWLDAAHLTERIPGEWVRGKPLMLDVPCDVPLVWLRLREYANRAAVSVRLRPRGTGRPAPSRVGGLQGFFEPHGEGTYTLDGEPLPNGVAFERVLTPGPHELGFKCADGETRRQTVDIISDTTLPLFEHAKTPFHATALPLPAPRGHNDGGSLARLSDGVQLVAYTTGESERERIVLARLNAKDDSAVSWEFPYAAAGPTESPVLLTADDGRVWMAYRPSLPAAEWGAGRDHFFSLSSTVDGKTWTTPHPIRSKDTFLHPPRLSRLPSGRCMLSMRDFFTTAESPDRLADLDRQIAPFRGEHADKIASYEERFAHVDTYGRMHVVLASHWPDGADNKENRQAYGLFYSYSDDLRHWAPLQLVQTTTEYFELSSFSLRGDRAAIVYHDSKHTWLWRGKVADDRLSMEPPVPIFHGGRGAGPLICEGDKCFLVFTREGYVPCLLEANADEVFGKGSAGQP